MKHDFARRLRRDQTDVERKLWLALRSRRFYGFKFRRQQPIGPYIVDFVCFEAKLIVELDGDRHGSAQGLARDAARTRCLQQDDFRILRFANRAVNANLDGVLDAIARAMGHCDPSPAKRAPRARASLPSPTRGEGF
jgi:adenine-specific DNA-methyltransferase